MTVHTEPTAAGELVVLNGKHRGTRCLLGTPVTVIGSAEQCDVRLTGPGVAEVHCLIALTPAGPALRSWAPDETTVNGEPTAVALLKDGDEVVVGPCVFRLTWQIEDLVPLTAAPADPVPASTPPDVPDAAWDLAGRERALDDQETRLASMLEYRRRQLAAWYGELVAAREEIRRLRGAEKAIAKTERGKVRQLREQADRLRKAARADRLRARTLYTRFLARMKARWSAEHTALAAERAELARGQEQLAAESARFREESARFRFDAEARETRLNDAWALLTDGQRRLLADRQEAERTLALRDQALTQWAAELAHQEETLAVGRDRVETRVRELMEEVARLEHRAAQTRTVVQNLEEQRCLLEAAGGPSRIFDEDVPLVIDQTRSVEQLITDLAVQDRELAKERKDLAAAWRELECRAAEIYDQRTVIAEQVAAVAVARQVWQTTECAAVAELETLARRLAAREQAVDLRARELDHADEVRRHREHELWELRARLEAWQASLAAHEGQLALKYERTEAELATRHDHLARWESSLATHCRKLAADREQDVARLNDELARWKESRDRYEAALSELDRKRNHFVAEAAGLAAQVLAVEQTRTELATGSKKPLAERRFRVLRRRWERHFARFRKDLDARREALAAQTAAADERYARLTGLESDVAAREAAVRAVEEAGYADRLARGRQLDERATILSIAEARAERSARDLDKARDRAEAIAAAVIGTEPPRLPAPPPRPVLLALAPAA